MVRQERQRGAGFHRCLARRVCQQSSWRNRNRKVLPNPSVKRSAIGRPPSPRSALVYPALHGLGVLPLSPAYLER